MSVELQFYHLKKNTIFKQTKLIEGCNTCFARCSDGDLAIIIETKRKNRNILNVADPPLAKPAANSNTALKGMQKSSSRSSGHSQTRSGTSSNRCCTAHSLNVIYIWELKKDLLHHMNHVHPLINLREIYFNQLCCVPAAHGQLDYCKISTTGTFTSTKFSSLNLFTKYLPGSYFMQLNTDPSEDLVHHALAVYVKHQWTKLSSSTDAAAIITDNSMAIGEVQKMDIEVIIPCESHKTQN